MQGVCLEVLLLMSHQSVSEEDADLVSGIPMQENTEHLHQIVLLLDLVMVVDLTVKGNQL